MRKKERSCLAEKIRDSFLHLKQESANGGWFHVVCSLLVVILILDSIASR
jgi:hypothetical protein